MSDPKLLLPEKLYAVPGFEINIYFQNVVTVINPANFAFDLMWNVKRAAVMPSDGAGHRMKRMWVNTN